MNITVKARQVSPTTTEGIARTHTVFVDRPEEKDGTDRGPMGGELFLLGFAGCFMSNLLAAVRAREASVSDVEIDVVATKDGSPERFTAIELHVSADYADKTEMEKLVTVAERGCLVTNTLRNAVDLAFTVT